jgi:hypothetical protein
MVGSVEASTAGRQLPRCDRPNLVWVGAKPFVVVPLVMLAAVFASSGCSSSAIDPGADSGDDRTAAVYEPILDWLLVDEPGVGGDEPADWVLFIASRSEQVIDIDVQASVFAALESVVEVRFIDDRAEAIDDEVETEPVKGLGLLVGLGAVPPEGDTVEVYADRYRDLEQVDAWQFTVSRADGSWEVDGEPTVTDVRPLPPGT